MSTATLNNLLEYLYGALSRNEMSWVANHLIEHLEKSAEEPLKPYTIEELHERIRQSEADFAAGRYTPAEDLFRKWGMELDEEEERALDRTGVPCLTIATV